MAARRFFVGGNWKANGDKAKVEELITMLNAADIPADVDVMVSPPTLHLAHVKASLKPEIAVAAQNCYMAYGAYTGETPAEMLVDADIPYTLLGHSERRAIFGESSELIAEKTALALDKGLKVVLCIGETLEERKAGKTMDVVRGQLQAVLEKVGDAAAWLNVVVAYEPVWAIGTGEVATPAQAQEVHEGIRGFIAPILGAEAAAALRIIYGGSVKGANCKELGAQPDIDGFLVGGASLKADFVENIIRARL
jgi:triosephosphate isomerase